MKSKNIFRRYLSLVVTLALVINLIPIHSFADSSTTQSPFGFDTYIGEVPPKDVPEGWDNDLWLSSIKKSGENTIYQNGDHVKLKVGETAKLFPWRVEQMTDDTINNHTSRPDFHFEILKGNSVKLSQESSTDSVMVTAIKNGDTILKVTYDKAETKEGRKYGASSAVNTAYVVYSVGTSDLLTIDTDIKTRYCDTIYFTDGETVPFEFSASAKSVSVSGGSIVTSDHAISTSGGAVTSSGNDTVQNDDIDLVVTLNGDKILSPVDGKYSAPLENRQNIIGFVAKNSSGKTSTLYKMIDARKIEIKIENLTRPDLGSKIYKGNKFKVSFRGITIPVPKLAGIYNPFFGSYATGVSYDVENKTVEGKCTQWDLATKNSFEYTAGEKEEILFSNGHIMEGWWGANLNDHFNPGYKALWQGGGIAPTIQKTAFSTFPDFKVDVVQEEAPETPLKKLDFEVIEVKVAKGNSFQLKPTYEFKEGTSESQKEMFTPLTYGVHYYDWSGENVNLNSNASYWAKVDDNGLISVNSNINVPASGSIYKNGLAVVAKAIDNQMAICQLKLKNFGETEIINVTIEANLEKIELEPKASTLTTLDTVELKPVYTPSYAVEVKDGVTWETSDDLIATVENGKVIPKTAGKVTITATSKANKSISATGSITISEPTNVDSIVLGENELTKEVIEAPFTVPVEYKPEGAHPSLKKVTWKAVVVDEKGSLTDQLATSYVSIDDNGKVSLIKSTSDLASGKIAVVATTSNGKSAYYMLTVIAELPATEEERLALKKKIAEAGTIEKPADENKLWLDLQEQLEASKTKVNDEKALLKDIDEQTEKLSKAIRQYKASISFSYKVTRKKVEDGTEVKVDFTNIELPNFRYGIDVAKLYYSTNIEGMARVETENGKDDPNVLKTLTFVVPKDYKNVLELTEGYVEDEVPGYRLNRPPFTYVPRTNQKYFENEMPDISIDFREKVSEVTFSVDASKYTHSGPDDFIVPTMKVSIEESNTVWDVLKKTLDEKNIPYDYTFSDKYNSVYVKSINNIAEFDGGPSSGWMYSVNGEFPNVGASLKKLENGDVIAWRYTMNGGRDLGVVDPEIETAIEELKKAITKAEAISDDNHTSESFEALKDALEKAKAEVNNQNASKDSLASAKKALEKAIDGLSEKIFIVTIPSVESLRVLRGTTYDQVRLQLPSKLVLKDNKEKAYTVDVSWNIDKFDSNVLQTYEAVGTLQALNTLPPFKEGLSNKVTATVDVYEKEKSYEKVLREGLDFIDKNLDNPTTATLGGDWSVLALTRSGKGLSKEKLDKYISNIVKSINTRIEKYNGKLNKNKSTEHSRLIIGATSVGIDPRNIEGYSVLNPLSNMEFVKRQGINGSIFALIALDTKQYKLPNLEGEEKQVTREMLIKEILGQTLPSGGWSYGSSGAQADITAMAVQSLAPYYKTNAEVKTTVDKAIDTLSKMQNDKGGFVSWGKENSESVAQVIIALTAIDKNPHTEPMFIKNGNSLVDNLLTFAVEGGGFKHSFDGEVNPMATDQGICALVAYDRFNKGLNRLYDMGDVAFIDELTVKNPTLTIEGVKEGQTFEEAVSVTISAKDYKGNEIKPVVTLNDKIVEGKDSVYKLSFVKEQNVLKVIAKDNENRQIKREIHIKFSKKVDPADPDKPNNNKVDTVTLSIDKITIGKGYVISPIKVELKSGENVWNVLKRALNQRNIPFRYSYNEKYNSVYIESIDGDGEFDHGGGSGWMYSVNGTFPQVGASIKKLKPNDVVKWRYTTNLGKDVGGGSAVDKEDSGTSNKNSGGGGKSTGTSSSILPNKPVNKVLPNVDENVEKVKTVVTSSKDAVNKDKEKKLNGLKILFNDATNISSWATGYVFKAVNYRLVKGGGDKTFNPKKQVRRGELAAMLSNLKIDAKVEKSAKRFKDIGQGNWYDEAVEKVVALGIMSGMGEKFNPEDLLTREQLAVIVMKLIHDVPIERKMPKDLKGVSVWARESVAKAYALGIIQGDGVNFNPKENITREMATTIMVKVYERLNSSKDKTLQ